MADDMFELVPEELEFLRMMRALPCPAGPIVYGWLDDELQVLTDEDFARRADLIGVYGRRVGYAMWLNYLDAKPCR